MPELSYNNNDEIQKLKQYRLDLEWFQLKYPQLKKDFKGEYIAIKNKEIKGHNKDLEKLLKDLQDKNEDLDSIVIEFVNEFKSLYVL